mmetsp:Transcript_62275/g.197187  ORF Transcript_62275/g.197187 Transcript_62275/m.197187 type:complete len:208 (-) Transcript_62275:594-1217(-)
MGVLNPIKSASSRIIHFVAGKPKESWTGAAAEELEFKHKYDASIEGTFLSTNEAKLADDKAKETLAANPSWSPATVKAGAENYRKQQAAAGAANEAVELAHQNVAKNSFVPPDFLLKSEAYGTPRNSAVDFNGTKAPPPVVATRDFNFSSMAPAAASKQSASQPGSAPGGEGEGKGKGMLFILAGAVVVAAGMVVAAGGKKNKKRRS